MKKKILDNMKEKNIFLALSENYVRNKMYEKYKYIGANACVIHSINIKKWSVIGAS